MHFDYCPTCGSKTVERILGDDGPVPWCETCNGPLFDMFSTCVIVLAVNEQEEACLLHQGYISNTFCNLISGYMSPGETAEEACRREVHEETGLTIDKLDFYGSWWFDFKGLLMLGFVARVKKQELQLSCEVESAEWVPVEQAIDRVYPEAPGNAAYGVLKKYLQEKGLR